MKLLLTGAGGFVGSYFSKKYESSYEIAAFSFLRDDFAALDCGGVDTVVHLSALVHQMQGAPKSEYRRVNVEQTLALAERAKASEVAHFIFMSTVKVHGEESERTYTESSPCHPVDPYGQSKLEAEQALREMEEDDFKVSIIRTPIVYGYGVKANIKSLVHLVKYLPFLPLGGIRNKRSMVYIGNLCHLLDTVILQKRPGVFLASDDEAMSTPELVHAIARAFEKKILLVQVPFFASLLRRLKPSIYQRLFCSLAVNNDATKRELGIDNPYSTQEGINLMIKGEKT